MDYLKQILLPGEVEGFLLSSVLDKAVFCLGGKHGMLVNDECSSWYYRVGNFLLLAWDRRKEILYGNVSACSEVSGTECYGG